MATQQGYSAIGENDANPFAQGTQLPTNVETDNEEETPQNSGIMIHVVPETSRGMQVNLGTK